MREKIPGRRHTVVGAALMALGALSIVAAVPVSAGTRGVAQTPGPILVEGNATCAELAPDGVVWTELKVDPVVAGPHTDGTLTVTITLNDDDPAGPTFDWSSNIGVDAVFVKGGDDGNLYLYDPESTGDSGLHAPTNPNNDTYFGLSHISFCYDADTPPTTSTTSTSTTSTSTTSTSTTSTSTTSTTAPTTTTSTTSATTTTGKVTTTTAKAVAAVPTTAPSPPAPARQLPRTGVSAAPMVIVGALLFAVGIGLVARSRRLRQS